MPPTIRFFDAFRFWLRLGFISFGGPAGQIAIMHDELVTRRRWISDARFMHALNYCMILPGPEAQQLAVYLGWLFHRIPGGILAGMLFILPSFFILVGLSWLYAACGQMPAIHGAFAGVKAAVVALVIQAAFRLGKRTLRAAPIWCIAVFAWGALYVFNLPFPFMILCAALVGALMQAAGMKFEDGHAHSTTAPATYECDPHQSATPAHIRWSARRCVVILLFGVLAWILPYLLIVRVYGSDHLFGQLAWFFTTAALLSFGGAYSVLPYVYQAAVGQYGWITGAQMLDGLALGETTPGPLIMVVSFVGFVAGYFNVAAVDGNHFIPGLLAATLVTWFTFLPSFVFVLAGAPMIESMHGNVRMAGPMKAISAAVVGVIVSLATLVIRQIVFPAGFTHLPDGFALLLAVVSCLALFAWRRGVIEVVLACALIGLVRSFV